MEFENHFFPTTCSHLKLYLQNLQVNVTQVQSLDDKSFPAFLFV